MLDLESNIWRQLPSCKHIRWNSSMCLLEGHYLYCFGSNKDIECLDLNSVSFNPLLSRSTSKTEVWQQISIDSSPTLTEFLGCFPIGFSQMLIITSSFSKDKELLVISREKDLRSSDGSCHRLARTETESEADQLVFKTSGFSMSTSSPDSIRFADWHNQFTFNKTTLKL